MSEPVLVGTLTDAQITTELLSPMWQKRSRLWFVCFGITGLGTVMLFSAITYTLTTGVGVWGNNIPVAWAFAIINFVWWIGIGHAGTFISAILLLFEQKWRTSINRFAEAMTLFAVVQAGMFPLLHMGRAWFGYWLIPYPATMKVWPNFKSSLTWDVAAVSTYLTISALFWYLGLIPDLAVMRDRAPDRRRRIIYGIFSFGWNGSARKMRHYRIAYLLLGGLAAPLVISVHSIVSSDFAIALVPGWHSTIFPPYFVAGAIFSGFAMVLTLMIPIRRIFHLEAYITKRHLENCAKMIMVTGWVVFYAYIIEFFLAWFSGDPAEFYTHWRAFLHGPNSAMFWVTLFCNCLVPQLYWSKWVRQNTIILFITSILINVGMWGERFSLIVIALEREFLPAGWKSYTPSHIDWMIFGGTCCFFLFLFLLFLRFVPFIPVSDIKELNYDLQKEETHA